MGSMMSSAVSDDQAAKESYPHLDDDGNCMAYKEGGRWAEFLALKHERRILGHSSNPVCGISMTEQVRLCAVWPTDNWLGSSLNQIQGWTTVRESYSRALEQGPLLWP